MEIFLGIIIGIAFCAYMPKVPLKLRSLLGWDKKDKKSKGDKEEK